MRLCELRVVQQVEELRPQLNLEAFAQAHILDERQVCIGVMRAVEAVSSRVPQMPEESAAESVAVGGAGMDIAVSVDARA